MGTEIKDWKMRYQVRIILLLLILSGTTKSGFGQSQENSPTVTRQKLEQCVSAIEPLNDILYRGKVFIPSAHPQDNHPFFLENRWSEGEVTLDYEVFNRVLMKFNIHADDLRFSLPLASRSVFVLPHPSRIESFKVQDHHFIRISTSDNYQDLPGEGFYEVLFESGVKCLVKHSKFLRYSSSGTDQYEPSERRYILNDGRFFSIRGRKDVLKALEDHEEEIKQYLRDNKIYIKGSGQDGLIDILRYYSMLKTVSNE